MKKSGHKLVLVENVFYQKNEIKAEGDQNQQLDSSSDDKALLVQVFGQGVVLNSNLNKALLTIATVFIGGTLFSIDKILLLKSDYLWLLWPGCSCLILSLYLSIFAQLVSSRNIFDISNDLYNEEKADKRDNHSELSTNLSVLFNMSGILFITLFSILSIQNYPHEELNMADNKRNTERIRHDGGVRSSGLGKIISNKPAPPPAPPASDKPAAKKD